MGIQGLHAFLDTGGIKCNINLFRGRTVGVDACILLHKGLHSVRDQETEEILAITTYCQGFLNLLISNEVNPIMVFDGDRLPAKQITMQRRRDRMEKLRLAADALEKDGNVEAAKKLRRQGIELPSGSIVSLIKTMRGMKVQYLVAPYEADAQLTYMAMKNMIDLVISEDSDFIVYGCPKMFFKMDRRGDGHYYEKAFIPRSLNVPEAEFDFERFRSMCILAGCDYLPNIRNIGLTRARQIMQKTKVNDIKWILKTITELFPDFVIPIGYAEGFQNARNTFICQIVFDSVSKKLVPLNKYPPHLQQRRFEFAGPMTDDNMALQIALGNTDPYTKTWTTNYDPKFEHELLNNTPGSIFNSGYVAPSELWNTEPMMMNMQEPQMDTTAAYTIPKEKETLKEILMCPICKDISPTLNSFNLHLQVHDKADNPVFCCFVPGCLKEFLTGSSYFTHTRSHLTRPTFACGICDKQYSFLRLLNVHYESHKGRKKYVCRICDNTFVQKRTLNHHIMVHGGIRKFNCSFCDQPFRMKSVLQSHYRLHTKETPYTCELCSNKFFGRVDSLKHHMKTHMAEKPFRCSFCPKSYIRVCSLRFHIRHHTGEKPSVCSICGQSFKDQGMCNRHTDKIHHTFEYNHRCLYCPTSFPSRHKLRLHTSLRCTENPHKCTVCNIGYKTKLTLSLHYRIHTKEKSYECPVCGKLYSICKTLGHHVRNHNKQNPP